MQCCILFRIGTTGTESLRAERKLHNYIKAERKLKEGSSYISVPKSA